MEKISFYLPKGKIAASGLSRDSKIQPGMSKTYYEIFEVPKNVKDLLIKLSGKKATLGF